MSTTTATQDVLRPGPGGIKAWIMAQAMELVPLGFRLLRTIRPIAKFGISFVVTRYDDVRDVFSQRPGLSRALCREAERHHGRASALPGYGRHAGVSPGYGGHAVGGRNYGARREPPADSASAAFSPTSCMSATIEADRRALARLPR